MSNLHAEGLEVLVLLAPQRGHRELAHRARGPAGGSSADAGDVARARSRGCIRRGSRLRAIVRLAALLAHARLHRQRQVVDLHAGVVVVELARHRPALRSSSVEIASPSAAWRPWPDVQRAGGVGRDELDHHPPARPASPRPNAAPARGCGARPRQREPEASAKLMKPGPAISALSIPRAPASAATIGLRQLARIALERLASCIATLHAQSPCAACFGRSSSTLGRLGAGNALRPRRVPDRRGGLSSGGRALGKKVRIKPSIIGAQDHGSGLRRRSRYTSSGSTSSGQRTRRSAVALELRSPVAQERLQAPRARGLHQQLRALEPARARAARARDRRRSTPRGARPPRAPRRRNAVGVARLLPLRRAASPGGRRAGIRLLALREQLRPRTPRSRAAPAPEYSG